jgi:hypothetical protein
LIFWWNCTEQQRMKIAQEIYTTEVSYVEALETACDVQFEHFLLIRNVDHFIAMFTFFLSMTEILQISHERC